MRMAMLRGAHHPAGPGLAAALLGSALAAACGPGSRTETYILSQAVSIKETIVYERSISFDARTRLYHVWDRYRGGGLQMDAFYSSFDKRIKEEYQCDFRSNTKEGPYKECHRNGRLKFEGRFAKGRLNGPAREWYDDGRLESDENWVDGRLHGRVRYWSRSGELQFDSVFENGMNLRPKQVGYRYLTFLPKDYRAEAGKKWPLVIYLHGGSDRGTDLKKLYSSGLPDQVYRGREFPFVAAAPQCPEHLRWSTDDWFECFLKDVISRYSIDADKVYLTGYSLGGSGTWYIAARYPDKFAAIAPISGFTSNIDYLDGHLDALASIPIWAFHGRDDLVVPCEETERMVKALEARRADVRFTAEPDMGHWIHWQVYPGRELYDWLLAHSRKGKARLQGKG
jgi:predicted esterase